jgi:hypothetical protein
MAQDPFKVPSRARRGAERIDFDPPVAAAPSSARRLQLPTLPPERPVTRGAVRAWQQGNVEPWSNLPGLRLKLGDGYSSTSDYGTASEKSSQSFVSNSTSPHEICLCENMSGIGTMSR